MAPEPRSPPWVVLTDFAVARWVEAAPPTREQFRHAFEWVLSRIIGGPDAGPTVVALNGDAVYRAAIRLDGRLEIHYDVYHPKRTLSVLRISSY